jgi:hypothetical protein
MSRFFISSILIWQSLRSANASASFMVASLPEFPGVFVKNDRLA